MRHTREEVIKRTVREFSGYHRAKDIEHAVLEVCNDG